jgi:hypothetical protein
MSAFFFHGLAATARVAGASWGHLLIEQLLAPAGHGVGVQAQKFGQDTIAAVPQLDGFQAGEQAALLLIQQTVEQHNGSLEFMGGNLESRGVGHQGNGERGLSSADLVPCLPAIGRSVEETSGQLAAA